MTLARRKPGSGRNRQRRAVRKGRVRRSKRKLKLDLRKVNEFKWELNMILRDVPEEYVGTLRGTIIAKATKIGIREAKDYVVFKMEEGVIDEVVMRRILRLLSACAVYR